MYRVQHRDGEVVASGFQTFEDAARDPARPEQVRKGGVIVCDDNDNSWDPTGESYDDGSVRISVAVSLDPIANALIGCFDVVSQWYKDGPKVKHATYWPPSLGSNWRCWETAPLGNGSITLTERDGGAEFKLNHPAIVRGLEIMARVAPGHFGDLMAERDDHTTHDVLVQCCCFGEVKYS